jgi:hypothetical protein
MKYLFVVVMLFVLVAPVVFAQVYNGGFSGEIEVGADDPGPITGFDDIVALFSKAARWMYTIFFIVAVMFILLAAYTYLSAGDDESKVRKATTMLKNAVIAIVVALLSSGVALIINNFLNP